MPWSAPVIIHAEHGDICKAEPVGGHLPCGRRAGTNHPAGWRLMTQQTIDGRVVDTRVRPLCASAAAEWCQRMGKRHPAFNPQGEMA